MPKYLSALEGTFDVTYFICEVDQKFKFPNYNKDNTKFLVKIKDRTKYIESYFSGYYKSERVNFNLSDFEKRFILPEIEVESFYEFIERLSSSKFDKKIQKGKTIYLFALFEEYLFENEGLDENIGELDKSVAELYQSEGFLKILNEKISKNDYIANLGYYSLSQIALENNLEPRKTKKALLNQLNKIEINVPVVKVIPTIKTKSYWTTFIDLYISNLKTNIDRFHPLYIESILEESVYINDDNKIIEMKLQELIKSNYWKDRLITKYY